MNDLESCGLDYRSRLKKVIHVSIVQYPNGPIDPGNR